MIGLQLAHELRVAGLGWRPAAGDRFAVPDEDAVRGRGRDTGAGGQPDRADAVRTAHRQYVVLDLGGSACRAVVRPAGTVDHPARAVFAITAGPPLCGRRRDLEPRRGGP